MSIAGHSLTCVSGLSGASLPSVAASPRCSRSSASCNTWQGERCSTAELDTASRKPACASETKRCELRSCAAWAALLGSASRVGKTDLASLPKICSVSMSFCLLGSLQHYRLCQRELAGRRGSQS